MNLRKNQVNGSLWSIPDIFRSVVTRREVFTGSFRALVASSLLPGMAVADVLSAADATRQFQGQSWRPQFVSAHQNEVLARLCELIIPATETPGAKEALVNRFLDHLMAVQPSATQKEFLAALDYMDEECKKRYKTDFLQTPEVLQIEFLTLIAYPHSYPTWGDKTVVSTPGNKYFSDMKGWISGAYYSSEIGMKELGWDGSFPHGDLRGCDHMAKLIAVGGIAPAAS